MKLKKIASICGKSKCIFLYDVRDSEGTVTQWIGDGGAAYPAFDLPYLERESVFAVLDVPDKQREKYYFRHITEAPQEINFADTDPKEKYISDPKMSVVYDGLILKPLQTRQGITFIKGGYLGPLEDVLAVARLYERITPSGGTYIVVKAGLLIEAVITPYDALHEGFVSEVERLARLCREALSIQRERAAAVMENQTRLFGSENEDGQEGGGGE